MFPQTVLANLISMRYLILLLTLFSIPCSAAVYKQIDEKGNVIYTDVPKKESEKPHKVAPITTMPSRPGAESHSENREARRTKAKTQKKQQSKSYSLKISSPSNDQAIRANDGAISLAATVTPGPGASHQVVFLLDGSEVAKGSATQVTVNNVPRGTHTVQVQLIDDGNIVTTSDSITFHVLRAIHR